jgi:hypothetical protein
VNVTVFDRARQKLGLRAVHALSVTGPAVVEAADFFAMRRA